MYIYMRVRTNGVLGLCTYIHVHTCPSTEALLLAAILSRPWIVALLPLGKGGWGNRRTDTGNLLFIISLFVRDSAGVELTNSKGGGIFPFNLVFIHVSSSLT
ncbi:hypothetical protein BDFG_05602 [Blastomyces dermatitidis ATCC 26199]|nr:hypothetical protein BDFG_05602 [Blastomyces dermatitidis ATCC 26199]